MNRGIGVLVLATLLAGCGPNQHQRQAAWMQAFQIEQDAVYQKWEADVALKWFSTNAAAVRDLKDRYEKLYSRWNLPMDPLSQALLSYAVALATRVDRGAITQEEAIRLSDSLRAKIDAGRATLAKEATQAQREAAMRQWWERFWSEHQNAYQATPANPIRCSILPGYLEGSSVKCE
jgi:hypothetical protein